MSRLRVICQDFLAREPAPAERRIEQSWYPIENGEITERVQGFSLAPPYSSRQLREIQRRHIKRRKLDLRHQVGFGAEVKIQ